MPIQGDNSWEKNCFYKKNADPQNLINNANTWISHLVGILSVQIHRWHETTLRRMCLKKFRKKGVREVKPGEYSLQKGFMIWK